MAISPRQARQFKKLCAEMAALLREIRAETPSAILFIEDGSVDLYDWPDGQRPDEPVVVGSYWPGAGGGGR